jgi:hypothetical protein
MTSALSENTYQLKKNGNNKIRASLETADAIRRRPEILYVEKTG